MSNYTPTGNPVAETRGTSSLVRNEFVLIQQAIATKANNDAANTFTGLQTFPGGISVTGGTYTGAQDFTGANITITTQSPGDNTTKAASTAFVTAAVLVETNRAIAAEALKAPINSPTFTGTVTIPSGASIAGYAPLASPTFTGTVTVPTPVNPTDAVTKAYADAASLGLGVSRTVYQYTATASQTTFSATYTSNYLDVFVNGVRLVPTDYTATNGTSVVLNTGCAVNDDVLIITYNVISLSQSNIAGGTAYSVPYQTAPSTTAFVSAGTAGYILTSSGTGAAPVYTDIDSNNLLLAQVQAAALCF